MAADSTENLAPPAKPAVKPSRIFVFSGHLVDAPNRPAPRFPPAKEPWVRSKIGEQLAEWNAGPGDLAITGAARGGDILFAELCQERGTDVWLFLPLTVEKFLDESVRLPGSDWEERFHALCAKPRVQRFFQHEHLGEDREKLGVHARNNLWMVASARALAPAMDRIYALVVWDEKPAGDGPGGTADFVARIRKLGGRVAPPINPTK